MSAALRQTTLVLADADATRQLAERLAFALAPGDVVLLDGPIGAGKTHFARALIQARLAAAGQSEDVPSPTFTLVQTYQAGQVEIWHADLYRLTHPEEIAELGLEQAFTDAICLVEWPDRLGPFKPDTALELTLTPDARTDARVAQFSGDSARWKRVFDLLETFDV